MPTVRTEGLQVDFDDSGFRAIIREFPRVVNQNANRGYRRVISSFARDFTRAKLRRGGPYFVQRKARARKTPPGQPAIPPKMKIAGFKAALIGRDDLDDKEAFLRTSNPALLQKEYQTPPRAKNAPYLVIKQEVSEFFRGVRGAKQKRAALLKRVGIATGQFQGARVNRANRAIIARVREAKPGKPLGMRQMWRSRRGEARRILEQEVIDASVRRARVIMDRRAASRAA